MSKIPTKKIIPKIKQYIEDNFTSNITLSQLLEKFLIEEQYLSRLYKLETGKNFITYLNEKRIECACSLLLNTNLSIQDITFMCGYNDYFYFSKVFKKYKGISPTQFREQARKSQK